MRNQTNPCKSQLDGHFFSSRKRALHVSFSCHVLHPFSRSYVHGGSEISKAFKGSTLQAGSNQAGRCGCLTHVNICSRASLTHRGIHQAVGDLCPLPPVRVILQADMPSLSWSPLKMSLLSSVPLLDLSFSKCPDHVQEICPMDILSFPNISILILLFRLLALSYKHF